MRLPDWTEDLSVGIPSIDEEHKVFVYHINRLYEGIQFGTAQGTLPVLLDKLINYSSSHFEHEESCMRETGFPGYQEHKADHDMIRQKLFELQDRLQKQQSSSTGIANETFAFMKDWLTRHILTVDKAYAAHFISHGIK